MNSGSLQRGNSDLENSSAWAPTEPAPGAAPLPGHLPGNPFAELDQHLARIRQMTAEADNLDRALRRGAA